MGRHRIVVRFQHSALTASIFLASVAGVGAGAQQLIGYVNTHDAEVSGASDVLNGQAVLTGSVGVTARDHTAPIVLGRGGMVRVCQTSVLHVTESKSADIAAPLLFSLDRGAVEIQMNSTLNDSIMTPDLRFTIANKGPLDLRLRVSRNGDTCVESRGPYAPTLNISDAFGETNYQVAAGQHVLFEHGSLREVVDNEQYPCGCPAAPSGLSVADALLASGGPKVATPVPAAVLPAPVQAAAPTPVMVAAAVASTAEIASVAPPKALPLPQPDVLTERQSAEQAAAALRATEEKHPFPAAISEGMAQPAEPVQAAAGAPKAQVTDSLIYNAPVQAVPTPAATAKGKKASETAAAADPSAAPITQAKPVSAAKPKQQQSKDLAHVVGRFFRRLFGG